MKQIVIILAYAIVMVAAPRGFDPLMQIAITSIVTLVFVLTFVAWASGSPVWALSMVVILTILFPVVVLLFVGAPVYASWVETLGVIVQSSREHGALSGLEWFVPLLVACVGVAWVSRMRSNKPLQATREDARA